MIQRNILILNMAIFDGFLPTKKAWKIGCQHSILLIFGEEIVYVAFFIPKNAR